jgi:hypothetical protein
VEDERALYKEGFPVVSKNQLTNMKYVYLKNFYLPSLLLTPLQYLQSLYLEDVQYLMTDSVIDADGNIKLLNLVKLCLSYHYSSHLRFECITVLLKLMLNLQSISTKTHFKDLEDGNEWSQILQLHCSKLMKFASYRISISESTFLPVDIC